MLIDFLSGQLRRAKYELIDEGRRYYGEIPGLRGVWAVGATLEECRASLLEVLEGWLILRLKRGLSVPKLKVPSIGRLPVGSYV
ncbi:MAG: type II toxin-antitoxin system HicB family antitoxin [Candidatus Liptonbacteria bacterium]|nr:type II toxin-antitoxin system HicB family antitoxin [Candidatus Liptonbacteria bacterium]